MKEVNYTVLTNEQIAPDTYKMTLSGDTHAITRPGQFVNFHIQGLYLRRPISVCRREENTLTIVYKVVGKGTEALSKMTGGEVLNALSGLGNGFDTAKSGDRPVLIAGGVGTPPMVQLCKDLREQGKQVTVCLGFRSHQDVILVDELEAMGAEVRIATEDGSRGTRGFVTNILPENATYFYACGPEPMLIAVYKATNMDGELSFEERMGCGFGACMGCTCKTKYGNKRICKDGPVLTKGEVIFDA